eukprot:scaffold73294_cov47-Prasinocladus_malaysianus.AAC.1
MESDELEDNSNSNNTNGSEECPPPASSVLSDYDDLNVWTRPRGRVLSAPLDLPGPQANMLSVEAHYGARRSSSMDHDWFSNPFLSVGDPPLGRRAVLETNRGTLRPPRPAGTGRIDLPLALGDLRPPSTDVLAPFLRKPEPDEGD